MDYKKTITEKGLKQRWIANKLGISDALLSLFLSGERSLKPEKESELKDILG